MSRLAILGAGGHGRVVADSAEAAGQWKKIVFFDDCWPQRVRSGNWAIVGDSSQLYAGLQNYDGVIVAIGDNRLRLKLTNDIQSSGGYLATVVHPRAIVSHYASVDAGTAIFAGAVVNIGARIGRACIINTSASIDHDCQLADAVHVSPGANLAGNVTVGECTWIGANAGVRHQISIGADITIGMGSVVVNHLQPKGTYVGNPAQLLLRKVSTKC